MSAEPNQRRRQARSADRKRAILEAAAACYREAGVAAVTIEHVADRSDSSIGSIYHHFGNKEGILAALFREAIGRYREGMLEILAQGTASTETIVKALVRYYVQWIAAHPDDARLIFDARRALRTTEEDTALAAELQAFYEPTRALLREAVEKQRIHDLPHHVVVAILLGPATELARAWLRHPERGNFSQLADMLADAAWRALRTA